MFEPSPDAIHPAPNIPSLCYIKNVITRPNIEIGACTYYDDAATGGVDFESHVTHHYEFIGDKLIIGKFCAIGKGVEFVMNGVIIGTNAVVANDIPPYTIAAGNPCSVTHPRFAPELTDYLLALRWWDWDEDKIFRNLEALCSGDLTQIRKIVP